MLKSYFITTLRSLKKNPVFTLVNVIGLSVGVAAFVLITLFVRDEITYDKFHTKVDRIYRGISVHDRGFVFGMADPVIDQMKSKIPGLEKAARIDFGTRTILKYKDELVFEDELYTADPEIFQIFDFPLLYGNENDALVADNSLVISKYIMNKYFEGKNPLGQTLKFANNDQTYIISGVLQDIPDNSRFQFNFIKTFPKVNTGSPWQPKGLFYGLFSTPINTEELSAQLKEIAKEGGYPGVDQINFLIEDFGDLYLESERSFTASGVSGDKQFINIFAIVGILLLCIACINYINSATAKSFSRLKEIGVRKVAGANNGHIQKQFLIETFVLTLISVAIAAGLAEICLPLVNQLSGKHLSLDYFNNPFNLAFILGLVPLITLLAGLYPSVFVSRFNALKIFKGGQIQGKGRLRKSLVVFQFAITLVLVFGTLIIKSQVQLFKSGDLGIDPKGVLTTAKPSNIDYPVFKSVIEGIAGVEKVVASPLPYGQSTSQMPLNWNMDTEKEEMLVSYTWTTPDFGKALGIEILQGRDFEEENSDDFNNSILISEAVAKKLAWENPIGQSVEVFNDKYELTRRTIIGVYQDINVYLKTGAPLNVMFPSSQIYNVNIKLSGENQEETIAKVNTAWNKEFGETPFEVSYLEDRLAANYEKEERFGQIFNYFSWLAILIAALGTFGLSAYTIAQKYKEIGIRKVLGASVSGIVVRLISNYVLLILVAMLIAVPVSFYFMSGWLQDFDLRISISPLVFLSGFGLALLVVILTIGYESIKAALSNPVDILRNE
ncbi:putative ABC transport system permease protein [Roseivirga ehrenbergii]|uniref:ABC transporter permease n=1 Tax=Roseivirga ehrenbergii (strain DSM 102268 / JCM 13514 / KCTC 12282 / NCIMB 14502 / KMM 6017) TaxID=279360 RepID=A0A150XDV3_ROSEK|nr:ABC transporter permease [Roseivirga ehrenbergii]KYG76866.1 hypothetical protein MB14_18520 [Roseivirga ehrenbergii]TCL07735.1 putative ABC transport system permease protein [Roseivirga ehrenbergii]